ncbi:hypothetical protein M8494_29050 [Serratia ureilytica]
MTMATGASDWWRVVPAPEAERATLATGLRQHLQRAAAGLYGAGGLRLAGGVAADRQRQIGQALCRCRRSTPMA